MRSLFLFILFALANTGLRAQENSAPPSELPKPPPLATPIEVVEPKECGDEGPLPDDIQVETTSRFLVERPWSLAKTTPRREMVKILTEAAEYVESQFPELNGFKTINRQQSVIVYIQDKVYNEGEEVLGTCWPRRNAVVISLSPKSLSDGETPVHEFVHAILRGNSLQPVPWLEEGVARYLEDKQGMCPAVRDLLIRRGVKTKEQLAADRRDCHSGACAWIVVKYLRNKGLSLYEILQMKSADIPEPETAFAAFVNWNTSPQRQTAAVER